MKLGFFKIDPMHEKKEFLRRAWISLAKEDVPLGVFDEDFGEVTEEYYHLLCTGAEYDMSWSGEIGNYRTESYIDIETYYDNEPYTDYEKTYDSNTKSYYQKPVTKYRKVEKQRQVKKERRVTDWHSGSGDHSGLAKSWECIDARNTFNEKRYAADVHSDDFISFSRDELENATDMVISEDMHARADVLRRQTAERNLRISLPGDDNRNITYRMNSYTPTYASLFRVPEYSAPIVYKGHSYVKRAFVCGNMTMENTSIPNPISAEEEKKKLHQERDEQIERQHEQMRKNAWDKALPIYLASIGLIALSIVMSLFVHFYFPVVFFFVAAIGAKIFAGKYIEKIKKEATDKLNAKIDELTNKYQRKIDDYSTEHMAEIFKSLNKKLIALGFDPVSEAEFYNY